MFKLQNLKSSLITNNKSNNRVIFNNIQNTKINNSLDKKRITQRIKSIKLSRKKSSEINYLDSDVENKENHLKNNDYEDLFFYPLLNMEKIEYFENLLMHKKERRITNNYYFLNIFESFTGDKIYWNNFYFPKYIFILFYLKSRNLQKEIIKYSISKGKEIMDVINSYNKKYTSHIKIKNWKVKPPEAFSNYEKIRQNTNSEIESSNKNNVSKITSFTDFVIRTNNKGKGKTLIFLGKTINIYIDDIEKDQNRNNGLSMATEDSEFNTKVKNEIIYTFDDAAIKAKKGNLSINNKNVHNINNLKNNNMSFSKNKFRKIKENLKQSNNKNFTFKFKDKYVNKKELKKKLLSKYMKQSDKLPLINLSNRNSQQNRKIINLKARDKNETFDKTKNKYKWPITTQNKKNKRTSFNDFLFNYDDKKDNKTIINFFSKKDNDFYY